MWSARPSGHPAKPADPSWHGDANPTDDGAECHSAPLHRRPGRLAVGFRRPSEPSAHSTSAACPAAEAQRPRTGQQIHRHHPPCQTSICSRRPSRRRVTRQEHISSMGRNRRLRWKGIFLNCEGSGGGVPTSDGCVLHEAPAGAQRQSPATNTGFVTASMSPLLQRSVAMTQLRGGRSPKLWCRLPAASATAS